MNAASPDDLQERIESLVAEALEHLDLHGEAALAEFLGQHPAEAREVERVMGFVRSNGLLAKVKLEAHANDVLGDFRLVERIGGGGMGVVFAAEQLSLRRRVAVKIIRGDLLFLDSARTRFRREVEAVASLHHAGIVRVIGVGETESVPYFAMELVAGRGTDVVVDGLNGRDPATLHASDWPLAPANEPWWRTCVGLATQVTEAMAHAHSRGVVHRDLKPSNIMVTAAGAAVVIDFGLAHIEAMHRMTLVGAEPGSPAYMSPEQLRGEPSDERADIYSLGATLHEWLGLQAPFRGDSLLAIREQALRGEFVALRTRNRAVPRDLETVCAKAMDLDRERRYASMEAFGADLRAVLALRPIAARRASFGLRLMRWSQRNRAGAAALVTFLMVGLLIPVVLYVQEVRSSKLVRAQFERAQSYLGISLDAVDRLFVSLGETGLEDVPGAELVSLRALEEATALHRRLVADQPDSPELRWARANVLASLARVLTKLDRKDEATPLFEEVFALLGGEELGVELPRLQKRAGARGLYLGLLLSRGDAPAVAREAEKLRRELQVLQAADTSDQVALEVRARLGWGLAVVENDLAVREAMLLAAQRDYEAMTTAGIADAAEVRRVQACVANGLATIAHSLTGVQAAAGRNLEWLQVARAAIARLRTLPTPSTEITRRQLGLLLQREGLALRALGQDGSEAPLREAVQILASLYRDFPSMPIAASTYGSALHNLAIAIRAISPAEATRCMEKAIEMHAQVLVKDPTLTAEQAHMENHVALLVPWLVEAGELAAALPQARHLGELQGSAWRPYAAAQQLAELVGRIQQAQPRHHVAVGVPVVEGWIERGLAAYSQSRVLRDTRPWLDVAMQFLLEAERRGWPAGADLDAAAFHVLHDREEFTRLRARVAR